MNGDNVLHFPNPDRNTELSAELNLRADATLIRTFRESVVLDLDELQQYLATPFLRNRATPPVKLVVEHRYTRDAVVPVVAGDSEFNFGWSCIPQQPTSDDTWTVFDTSKDNATGWRRIRFVDGVDPS